MSAILTNEVCNKCNKETLTIEQFLDGHTEYCSNCGYKKEDFSSDEEYAECLAHEASQTPDK